MESQAVFVFSPAQKYDTGYHAGQPTFSIVSCEGGYATDSLQPK